MHVRRLLADQRIVRRRVVCGLLLLGSAATAIAAQPRAAQGHTPMAHAQHVVVKEDGNVLVTLSGSDADRHRLTFVIVSEPLHGRLGGRPPRLIYTPAVNYNGIDTFTFKAADGRAESDPATVSITVTPVNDPPTAVDDVLIMGTNVKGFVGPGAVDVLLNDSDAPDAGETLTVVNTQQGADGGTGFTSTTVYYLPNGGFVGKDRFTYTVCDNGTTNGVSDPKCTLAIVSVTVKDAIAADLSVSVLPSAASVPASSDVTFVITVRNDGPDDASLITYGLQTTDMRTSLVSVTGAPGRCASGVGKFECVLATLAPGATVTATAVMNMTAAGDTHVSAYVSSATDATPANNLAVVAIEVR